MLQRTQPLSRMARRDGLWVSYNSSSVHPDYGTVITANQLFAARAFVAGARTRSGAAAGDELC